MVKKSKSLKKLLPRFTVAVAGEAQVVVALGEVVKANRYEEIKDTLQKFGTFILKIRMAAEQGSDLHVGARCGDKLLCHCLRDLTGITSGGLKKANGCATNQDCGSPKVAEKRNSTFVCDMMKIRTNSFNA